MTEMVHGEMTGDLHPETGTVEAGEVGPCMSVKR